MTRGSQHLRSLTSLRFFAALAVVAYHAGIQTTAGYFQPYAVLRFGYLGVTLFFVLSGFVLVWAASPTDTRAGFYRRRFARVWPVHALTLVAAVLLAWVGLIEQRGAPWTFFMNIALVQAWWDVGHSAFGFNGVAWSLSCEVFFYAVFPFLLPVVRRIGPVTSISVAVGWLLGWGVAIDSIEHGGLLTSFPPYRIGEFVIGMGLALWVQRGGRGVRPAVALSALGGSYLALLVLNRVSAGELALHLWLVSLLIVPSIGMVLVACATRDVDGDAGWLTHPWSVRLGQWSFALYMVHELILRAANPLLRDHHWLAAPAVVSCIAVAGAVYEWFERPLERQLRGSVRGAVQLEDVGSHRVVSATQRPSRGSLRDHP